MMFSKKQILKAKRNIHLAANLLPDEYLVDTPEICQFWMPYVYYKTNEKVVYDGKLYKIVQSHTSSETWLPDITPALYTEITFPGEIGVWKQPTGAQDVYSTGDKVYYPDKYGKIYVSICDNNAWEPTVYGWEEL